MGPYLPPHTMGPCAVQNPTAPLTSRGKSGKVHWDSGFGHTSVFFCEYPSPVTTKIRGLVVVFSSSVQSPKPRFAHSKKASKPTCAQFKTWVDKVAAPEVAMLSSGCDATDMAKVKAKKILTILGPSM